MTRRGAVALAALLAAGTGSARAQFAVPPAESAPVVRRLAVEVRDFTFVPAGIKEFPVPEVANPLEQEPPPLLDPAELDRLPEVDRLPILLKEQEARREWQERKREIDLKRYNERLEADSKVRDAMLTEEGRAIRQGRGIMEAALGARPDVFALVQSGAGTGITAPADYQVEGTVGDLAERRISQVRGFATEETTLYRLPVTIRLHETGSGRTIWVYSEELSIRDIATGGTSRQEAVRTLLRRAAKAAAEQFAAACLPLARTAHAPTEKTLGTGTEGSPEGI